MNGSVIRADNLGKRYRIGERERYLALRDVFTRWLLAPARMLQRSAASSRNGERDYIWALRGVGFEVREGEVLGIIGRNGAGKTTLLKILARVTRPTEGYAEVRGRMGSLLEVGTGFHQELTGRENLYLSGAILGMSKLEIDQKFDEIVAFSEVEKFLDTPLKHYSTGMMMRLAFAVAAHLEPEILLVDEVLAVGDLEFQKKCLGKMGEVAKGGRTILFVSHQMIQIRRLCDRALWLHEGAIRAEGPPGEVVAAYEALSSTPVAQSASHGCFLHWSVCGDGNVVRDGAEGLGLHFLLNLREEVNRGHFGVAVLNESNVVVTGWGFDGIGAPPGRQEIIVRLPSLPLRPGVYSLYCALYNRGNNLTGGKLMERWYATPPLVVDTVPVSHPQDRWAGVLNLPAEIQILPGDDK
jgi:ABC-type polysaccharide/polyol phosphate transport system ATPase subunit